MPKVTPKQREQAAQKLYDAARLFNAAEAECISLGMETHAVLESERGKYTLNIDLCQFVENYEDAAAEEEDAD